MSPPVCPARQIPHVGRTSVELQGMSPFRMLRNLDMTTYSKGGSWAAPPLLPPISYLLTAPLFFLTPSRSG